MIVVVGQPQFRAGDTGGTVDGLPAQIALVAADLHRPVQLVGKAGEDPEGDAVVLALARGGVGHVALLRDAGMTTPRAPDAIDGDLDPLGDDQTSMTAPVDAIGPGSDPMANTPAALDAADVDLALRYLTHFSVVVLADPVTDELAQMIATAAVWADARVIAVVPSGAPIPEGLPDDAVVFEAPDHDPEGVFATLIGGFAAALDDGGEPAAAFAATLAEAGWQPSIEG